jgi:DNA polymerase delta subunit 1
VSKIYHRYLLDIPLTPFFSGLPPAKRARVSLNGNSALSSQKLQKQESFTEVLAKLEQDSVAAEYGSADMAGIEGDEAIAGGKIVGGHIESSDAWPRPRLPHWDAALDDVLFQQIDVEESNDPSSGATLRLFGVTKRGNSVLTHVHGFRPYFYVAAPVGFISNHLQSFKDKLNSSIATGMSAAVLHTALVKKKNLWGYRGDDDVVFIKITCPDQKAIPKVKGAFERGQVDWEGFSQKEVLTFESNIQYTLRFMVDTRIVGMNWIEIAAGEYSIRKEKDKVSNCQLEIDVNWKKLKSHPTEGEGANLAPLRILSFDIECAGRKGIFPEASMDPVIQIAAMVTRQGESKPFVRNVFTLNTCAHIVGSQVLEFKDERQMLVKWREFVETVDPDLVIGYNISNFDLPYLLDRAKALKVGDFPYLGRLKSTYCWRGSLIGLALILLP